MGSSRFSVRVRLGSKLGEKSKLIDTMISDEKHPLHRNTKEWETHRTRTFVHMGNFINAQETLYEVYHYTL